MCGLLRCQHFDDYVFAVKWAQNFAAVSRDIMMHRIVRILRKKLGVKFMMDEEATCALAVQANERKTIIATRMRFTPEILLLVNLACACAKELS